MAYGYNAQGQIVWVDDNGPTMAFDPHSGASHPMGGGTPIIAYGPNRNITPGEGWIDPKTQNVAPQSSEELGAIYDRSPSGTPEGRAKFIAAMQAPDTRRAPTQDTSGPIWNIIRGKLPPGKKYDSQGNIVNTTNMEKFDTGFNNAAAYGGAGLGIAAGGLALGALAAGAYGAGAAGSGAAAGGGGAAAGGTGGTLASTSLGGYAAVPATVVGSGSGLGAAGGAAAAGGGTLASSAFPLVGATPGTITGSGAALGPGFGAAEFGTATTPTLASTSLGGYASTPANITGSGPVSGSGSTGSTLGQTVAKKAAKQAAKQAVKEAQKKAQANKTMKAGAIVAPAVAGLYAATRGGGGGGSMDMNQALTALLQQQQDQMQEESPLRKLLLSQQAGMLPSYMKRDPQYQQWLQNSAPAAQSAMNAAVQRPPYLT